MTTQPTKAPKTISPADRDDDLLLAELTDRLRASGFFAANPGHYGLRLAILLPLFAASFAGLLLLTGTLPWLFFTFSASFFAVLLGLIAHDAGHRAIARRRWPNDLWGHVCMTLANGLSFSYWRMQHNRHHRHCQDEDRDPDMQYGSIFSVYGRAAAQKQGLPRLLLPWQAYYFWLAAGIGYSFSLRIESLRQLFVRPRATRADRFVLLCHYLLWLGLPALFLGPLTAALTYFLSSIVIGLYITLIFSVNHMGMPSIGPGERWTFLRQQVETSRNIEVPAPFEFLFGGLHHQIEHHLFPQVSPRRLRAGRHIVEAFCRDRGIVYTSEGFFAAHRARHRHLVRVSGTAGPIPESPFVVALPEVSEGERS